MRPKMKLQTCWHEKQPNLVRLSDLKFMDPDSTKSIPEDDHDRNSLVEDSR